LTPRARLRRRWRMLWHARKTSLRSIRKSRRASRSIGNASSLDSAAGEPLSNTMRTATSSGKETLRIPCSTFEKAGSRSRLHPTKAKKRSSPFWTPASSSAKDASPVTRGAAQEGPRVYEAESQFKGIRGFLWLAVGSLLLAAAIGSGIYIVARLLDYL